ncbi:MAG: tetratricopeptide repeat protein [Fibrobacterales bacterium]
MNIKILISVLLLCVIPVLSSIVDNANKAYDEGEYQEAIQLYLQAQVDMPESQILDYNIGTSFYRLKKYDKANESLRKAALGEDSVIARNAYYNMGNTAYREGNQQQEPKAKIDKYKEAIASLKKSLEEDDSYEKAKRNIEFIQIKLKEELDKHKDQQDQQQDPNQPPPPPPSKEAKAALAKALQLASQELYHDAKGVLEDIMNKDETAGSYKTYVQRLQDVIDINEGRKPETPLENNPGDTEIGVI